MRTPVLHDNGIEFEVPGCRHRELIEGLVVDRSRHNRAAPEEVPSSGRLWNASTISSSSQQSLETSLLLMPVIPMAWTRFSTFLVLTPLIHTSCTTALSLRLRGSRNGGWYSPS